MKKIFFWNILSTEERKQRDKIEKNKNQIELDFKFIFLNWCEENNVSINTFGISLIECTFNKSKNIYDLNITTNRPGLIIGKAGRFINELTMKLNEYSKNKYSIKICLNEFNPFDTKINRNNLLRYAKENS